MKYYLYEIKNNINSKIYVGVHKTKVEDDGYMGSGEVIKRAIKKHGVENFTKTILEYFDTQESMFAREKSIITDEFLGRDDVYNLRRGGYGGFDHINKTGRNNNHRFNVNDCQVGGIISGNTARNQKTGIHSGDYYGFRDKTHRKIMLEKAKIANSGTIWINDGKQLKKIKKDLPIPDGWVKGKTFPHISEVE
jgi:GIY-YIG catalytic domain